MQVIKSWENYTDIYRRKLEIGREQPFELSVKTNPNKKKVGDFPGGPVVKTLHFH